MRENILSKLFNWEYRGKKDFTHLDQIMDGGNLSRDKLFILDCNIKARLIMTYGATAYSKGMYIRKSDELGLRDFITSRIRTVSKLDSILLNHYYPKEMVIPSSEQICYLFNDETETVIQKGSMKERYNRIMEKVVNIFAATFHESPDKSRKKIVNNFEEGYKSYLCITNS